MKLIGITGPAGSGKSTVADLLKQYHGFVEVAFADVMKRFCKEVFGWSDDTLWGPSEARNTPDPRAPWLTPRRALQTLGTEWGRALYRNVWVDSALRVVKKLAADPALRYYPDMGLVCVGKAKPLTGVVISDVRFDNEATAIRAAGGCIWRLEVNGLHASDTHPSEAGVPQHNTDQILHNDKQSIDALARTIERLLVAVNKAQP